MADIKVFSQEEYKIFDKLMQTPGAGPKGWFQMYMHKNPGIIGEPCVDKQNLVVAKGREFVAQKIFETSLIEDGTNRPAMHGYKVSHFGVGGGGASVTGQDITLYGPTLSDNGLYQPISLGDESYLEEPSKYEDTSQSPIINSYRNAVKPIDTHGQIYLEPVAYEDSPNYYTKVKCTCVIPAGEPSQLAAGGSVQISEAGLYFVNQALADTDPDKTNMFAHISFSPKWKEKESTITIFWYVLF